MAITDFTLIHPLRVRWSEIDMQGVVFNGHYLNYMDVGIAEYWRAAHIAYPQGFVDRFGVDFYVVKSVIEYHGSARYDELLNVCARAARFGRSSMSFKMEIHRQGDHLISGELVYVCADPKTQKSQAIPESFKAQILAFEKSPIEQS
jgi:acyl-CoA thioester hydrolase